MADDNRSPDMQRNLQELFEATKRLRQRAKENDDEAERIMKLVKQLEQSSQRLDDRETS